MKNINLGATFLFLSILCSIKIERLLFLKFLKNLAFFDSHFWPFNKTDEKLIRVGSKLEFKFEHSIDHWSKMVQDLFWWKQWDINYGSFFLIVTKVALSFWRPDLRIKSWTDSTPLSWSTSGWKATTIATNYIKFPSSLRGFSWYHS